ncbi:MAG: phosphate acyltransferase PlsX [Candidatus Hydrogenedentota bacterium]
MVRIVVDAMGSDKAPKPEIFGALLALDIDESLELILVGEENIIKEELSKISKDIKRIEIIGADSAVTMDDIPTSVIRNKKDSSIVVATKLVAEGRADAMVTAGNTGASMVACKLNFGLIEGIERPGIAALLPTKKDKPVILIDIGANVDCKPLHLAHFAIMGASYSQWVIGIRDPKVGLLNIGEEDTKGNDQTKNAFKLLKNAPVNFIGNVEGRDIIKGDVDVIVCDGFIGNIILKFGESVGFMVMEFLKRELANKLVYKIGAYLAKPAFLKFKKKVDYSEYGGAPLLGLKNVSIICHGSSNSNAICNAILFASNYVKKNINEKIGSMVSNFRL